MLLQIEQECTKQRKEGGHFRKGKKRPQGKADEARVCSAVRSSRGKYGKSARGDASWRSLAGETAVPLLVRRSPGPGNGDWLI